MQTLEEIINEIRNNLENISPSQLADYSIKLSIFLEDIDAQRIKAEVEYARQWALLRLECNTDKETDNSIMMSDAWAILEGMKAKKKSVERLISSLNKRTDARF